MNGAIAAILKWTGGAVCALSLGWAVLVGEAALSRGVGAAVLAGAVPAAGAFVGGALLAAAGAALDLLREIRDGLRVGRRENAESSAGSPVPSFARSRGLDGHGPRTGAKESAGMEY